MKNRKIFVAGALINCLASMPLGVLNMTALQILLNSGEFAALCFVCGCVMGELIYVRISLLGPYSLLRHEQLLKMLNWLSLCLMIVMAISSVMASVNHGPDDSRHLFSLSLPPFMLGFTLMLVNVMVLPFWFGWNSALFTRKILLPDKHFYNYYLMGISLGSLAGNCLFIFSGRLLIKYMHGSPYTLNAVTGIIIAISAIVHYMKMSSRPAISIYKKTELGG